MAKVDREDRKNPNKRHPRTLVLIGRRGREADKLLPLVQLFKSLVGITLR